MINIQIMTLFLRAEFIMMAANRTGTGTNRVNRNRVNRFCEPNRSEPEPDFGVEKIEM